MKRLLVVIDMQNDFIDGALGTKEAEAILPKVVAKVKEYQQSGASIVFTQDTHTVDYLNTREGRNLPVAHCIKETTGWEIADSLAPYASVTFEKPTFGSLELADWIVRQEFTEIELVGLCTDICVISNALLIKAHLPEVSITVDSGCCAGVTPDSHQNAIDAMKMCQIQVI